MHLIKVTDPTLVVSVFYYTMKNSLFTISQLPSTSVVMWNFWLSSQIEIKSLFKVDSQCLYMWLSLCLPGFPWNCTEINNTHKLLMIAQTFNSGILKVEEGGITESLLYVRPIPKQWTKRRLIFNVLVGQKFESYLDSDKK